jgi:hypothetical protein
MTSSATVMTRNFQRLSSTIYLPVGMPHGTRPDSCVRRQAYCVLAQPVKMINPLRAQFAIYQVHRKWDRKPLNGTR